jgi:hypothetical protein
MRQLNWMRIAVGVWIALLILAALFLMFYP